SSRFSTSTSSHSDLFATQSAGLGRFTRRRVKLRSSATVNRSVGKGRSRHKASVDVEPPEIDAVPPMVVNGQRRAQLGNELSHGIEVNDLGIDKPLRNLFVGEVFAHA